MAPRSIVFALILAALLAVPALAWKGEGGLGVRPIAEVTERAEIGDYVAVEGQLIEIHAGQGSLGLGTLEDASGRVVIAVPNYVTHAFADENNLHRWFRVSGKWDRSYFEEDQQGIRVQKAEAVER